LSSALGVLASVLASIEETMPADRVVLLGFSQGACLTLEFAARHARRYGGVVGLSGGLIGPDGTPRDYPGDFAGTPAFLGCSDIDPHIPKERVLEAGDAFKRMGAEVVVRLYPGMLHTVSAEEIGSVNALIKPLATP
jgi:predicted esterase